MSWSCRRPGCGRPAFVAISFDAEAREIYLDSVAPAASSAQPICPDHMDRLRPPQGWTVIDRRIPSADLADGDQPLTLMEVPSVPRDSRIAVSERPVPRRHRRIWGRPDQPALEFRFDHTVAPPAKDEIRVEAGLVEPVEGAVAAPVMEPPDSFDVDVPPAEVLVADVPQAEEAAAEVAAVEMAAVEVAAVEVAEPVAAPEPVAAAEPVAAKPEEPPLEATTLVKKKPTGRLLSRAFDLIGDQRSVLTQLESEGNE